MTSFLFTHKTKGVRDLYNSVEVFPGINHDNQQNSYRFYVNGMFDN